MSTITTEQEQHIAAWLAAHPTLTVGVGTEEAACSVAAINMALTGELTDRIPVCMSRVIGRWIIAVQDMMPAEIRNSAGWRDLLPLAAGTGRAHEEERRAITLAWMWDTLALIQPVADRRGYGDAWRRMTTDRTAESARAAAAYAAAAAAARRAFFHDADPVGCLRRLIAVTDARVNP